MGLVSLTRLRLHSWHAYPAFSVWVLGSLWQSLRAEGLVGLQLLRDRQHAFWTLTLWRDSQSMEAFRNQGAHGQAMRHLAQWCDESAAAHWSVSDEELAQACRPQWNELQQRLMQRGHFAALPLASEAQRAHLIPDPALGRGRVIRLR
jgi:hypothetical protein